MNVQSRVCADQRSGLSCRACQWTSLVTQRRARNKSANGLGGNCGRYFKVLNSDSEYGLSLLTAGRLQLCATLRRQVNVGASIAVPPEIRKWVRGRGRVPPGLAARRDAEAASI
jgi:hypothetical protein